MQFKQIYERIGIKLTENEVPSNLQVIQAMIQNTLIKTQISCVFEKAKLRYNLNSYKLAGLNPQLIVSGYKSLSLKLDTQKSQNNKSHWSDNELRIFVWLIVVYSFNIKKYIENMKLQDWLFLSHIFNNKDLNLIQFEALLISNQKSKGKKWCQQQKILLQEIIKPFNQNKKWKQIAQQLFYRSNRCFFRTPKQCRQHWLNYLDPNKLKAPWAKIQDYILLNGISKIGKKWAQIAKFLDNKRTQHTVKNRYNSLIKSVKGMSMNQNKLLNILLSQYKHQIGNNQLIEGKNQIQYYQNIEEQKNQKGVETPKDKKHTEIDYQIKDQDQILDFDIDKINYNNKEIGTVNQILLIQEDNYWPENQQLFSKLIADCSQPL